ncbi:hypothetical protein OAA06_00785 [bacterium]|nr:hypothetical protein [bacterium]
MKYFILSTLLIWQFTCFAQNGGHKTFEQMKKEHNEGVQKMRDDYQQTVTQMRKEYDDYVKKINADFSNYLKGNFEEYDQKESIEKPVEEPKPIEQPDFKPEKKPVDKPIERPVPKPPKIEWASAPANSIAPITKQPESAANFKQDININFFGTTANLAIDKRMGGLALSAVSPDGFVNYWKKFTATYYQTYIESLITYSEITNLNDWGIYILIKKTATQLFSDRNNRNIWMWAMLNQAGYQAKIGYHNNSICLMLPFIQEVYEKPYYKIEGNNYYVINNSLGKNSLLTYAKNFGGATKKIDLHLPFSLNFSETSNNISKNTSLPQLSQPLKLRMNKTVIDFLASFPQTDKGVYLNAAMSQSIKEDLYEKIASQLKGKSEADGVTYLLNYLHNSFEYKTDRDQFGKEKMFFPDEIFYYPFSDCEDRAVLFTKLVNDLLGLDVIALTYFSHMSAAVAFNTPIEGHSLIVDGRKYTVCDPTFLNAPIGSVMPQYEKYTPLAIKINNNSESNNVWQSITYMLEKNNDGKIYINDRAIAENGSFVVSGWYENGTKIGAKTLSTLGNTRDLWYATFSSEGRMEWFLPVKCSGSAFTQAFGVGKKGNVYSLINYSGTININQREICSNANGAHLVLGLSNKSYPILHENIDFNAPEGQKLAFYGKYKPDGTKVDLVSFPTDKVRFASNITVDSNNDVVVRGVVGEIEGLTTEVPIMLGGASFSAEQQIESYTTDYKERAFSHKVAGLFATIKLLSQNGGSISGSSVQNLLRKNNPGFSTKNPSIYKSITSMQFVINKSGVVNIKTASKKNISLDVMRIKNNSNMQIVKSSASSYKMKFINGVEVGKAFIWYKLNSITLNKDGSLVFDYDDDHTKKRMAITDIVD